VRKENYLKQKLESGAFTLGTFNVIPSSSVVNILGCSGFDFVIIDSEHGPISMETAEDMIRAAELEKISPIIRVTENRADLILRALDIGAHGVQIPQISTAEQAEKAVSYSKYPPAGERGLNPFTRAGGYSVKGASTFAGEADRNTLVILNVEGTEGVRNLDAICKVKGVDVVFIGPYDLSASVGKPGKVDDPVVVDAIRSCAKKIKAAGKIPGCFASNLNMLKLIVDSGYTYNTYLTDTAVIRNAYEQIADSFKSFLKK
jgi:4-hydroxy-2-oxoheptanedioate aldolase